MDAQSLAGPHGVDDAVLAAASAVIEAHGVRGLTGERLASALGCSRMTLHRRGITPALALDAMRAQAVQELHLALAPALSDSGTAAERLELAIGAVFDVAEGHLPILAGLFSDDDAVFHEGRGQEPMPTAEAFIAPFRRLLLDGALDGTIREVADPTETATVLFNAVGWTYVQLRWTQRWPRDRARRGVEALVLDGLRSTN